MTYAIFRTVEPTVFGFALPDVNPTIFDLPRFLT